MKTRVNKKLFILSEVLEKYTYTQLLEKIDSYMVVDARMEKDKRLLMYNFEDNDVEAQQIIDSIELQQYYVGQNLDILKEALVVKEKDFFTNFGKYSIQIGLN